MIEEGKVVKGGLNDRPKSKRPLPPKGQGFKKATFRCIVFYIEDDTDFSGRVMTGRMTTEDIGKERAI